MLSNLKLGFIGAGQMAEAMISGLLSKKLVKSDQILATEPVKSRAVGLQEKYGIQTEHDNLKALKSDVIIFAVKPQTMPKIIEQLSGKVDKKILLISIAAGITIEKLKKIGVDHIVRAMPNTPGKINKGVTVWTSSNGTTAHKKQAAAILKALGKEIFVEDERYLDMATALSGTGPAYAFLFMEALVEAGIRMGLPREMSEQLVVETTAGSALFAIDTKEHLALLRDQVTSPAGTTAEALFYLEKAGFRTALAVAVEEAYKRSIALGKI